MAKVSRRCGCRDETGKQYGANCPKLKSYRHGTWGFRLSAGFDPVTGKRRYVTNYSFTSSDEAEQAMAVETAKLRRGVYDFKRTTAADYIREWIHAREEHRQIKSSTLRMYKSYVANDIAPALGDKLLLRDLRRADVAMLIKSLQNSGRGAVTIKRIHAALSSALSDAVQDGLISENPAAGARLPRVEKKKVEVWGHVDALKFLTEAATHRLGPLFELTILTGMRRGELCGLRWIDVDLVARKIVVKTQLVQVGKEIVENDIKTEAGQHRVVPLSDRAVNILLDWQFKQGGERAAWAEAYQDSGRVFTYEDGTQLRPGYPSKAFNYLIGKMGLPHMTFHDLRHLFASIQLKQGTPIGVVSKMMGHSNIQITLDLYSHLIDDTAQVAADAAAAWLAPRVKASEGVLTSVLTEQ